MKRLEDIPKKNVFETPEGYFDKLPGIIQSRIVDKEAATSPLGSFTLALRFAIPAVVIAVALFFVFRPGDSMSNPEELLASVSTEELTDYLVESDFSTEDLLDNLNLDEVDINALNDGIYPELDSDILEEYANELRLEL